MKNTEKIMVVNKPKKVSIAIADANLLSCRLLADALEKQPTFHVTACVVDCDGLLEKIANSLPDIILIGARLNDGSLSGMATLQEIHGKYPAVPVIILLDHSDSQMVIDAFRFGAKGVFTRSQQEVSMLLKCVQQVYEGQIWANNKQIVYLLDALKHKDKQYTGPDPLPRPLLTPREESVVRLVVEGLGNREIAEKLNLSQHTVKNYLFRIYDKIGIGNRVELVLYAAANLNALDSPSYEAPTLSQSGVTPALA